MRLNLLLALAISCTGAAAQEFFILPAAPTQWDTITVKIRDTIATNCPGTFVFEPSGPRTFKGYFALDSTVPAPNCVPDPTQVVSTGYMFPAAPGTVRIDYYRPGASVVTASKTFTIDATGITRENPIEIIPAAPTSADVIRVRFRVYDTPCENLNGFSEGVELPTGEVILRFNFPVIVTLCPPPPPAYEYSIAPRPAGTFLINVADLDTGSTDHAKKTVTVTESAGASLPNVRDGAVNTSDLWQARGEGGWGVTLNQRGPAPSRLLATMYWYGPNPPVLADNGAPRWYVVTGGTWVRKNVYSGTIYVARGPAANTDYNVTTVGSTSTAAGTALLEFLTPNTMRVHVNWNANSGVYPAYGIYTANGTVPGFTTYPIYGTQSSFLATFDRLAF